MVSAVTHIELYGPPTNTKGELQKGYTVSNIGASGQRDYAYNASALQGLIHPAQHPKPKPLWGFPTADRFSFSDSPSWDDTKLVWQRYAFGRGVDPSKASQNTYGTLEGTSGAFVNQKSYTISNVGDPVQYSITDTGSALQKDISVTEQITEIQNCVQTSDIDVEQYAFLLEARPIPYSIKNPIDSDVYIRLANHSTYPLVSGTLSLKLRGFDKIPLDIQPFYLGGGGLDTTWINDFDFPYGSRIDVHWEVYDEAVPPNKLQIDYWFSTVEDMIGPRILNRVPDDNATNISISTYIIFDVVDPETGVDLDTLELYVNNLLVSNTSPNISIVQITGGYRVQYLPENPFLYGDTIPVVVKVRDKSNRRNLGFFIWSFSTEGSLIPLLINMSPSPCDVNVERIKNISFEVIDAGHGLVKESISMSIDNTTRDRVFIVPIIHRFD